MTNHQARTPTGQMNFSELCLVESRLRELLQDAQATNAGRMFCANQVWESGFRDRLDDLVGFHARKASLRSWAAHDVARRVIYSALPDCRGCSCFDTRVVLAMRLADRGVTG